MEIGSVPVSAQWEEIQRTVRDRSAQRQQLLSKQYGAQQQSPDAQASSDRDAHRQQRVVFTKSGQLQQNYVPKGTLFDKVG